MRESMTCVNCGFGDLRQKLEETSTTVGPLKFTAEIPALSCPKCGESMFPGAALEAFELQVADELGRMGQRVSWMLLVGALNVAAILHLGYVDPKEDIIAAARAALLVAFMGATYDIVIDAYRIELQEFLKTLRREPAATASGEDGRRALLLANAAQQSLETGLAVRLAAQ